MHKTPEITRLIHDNLWVVMSYAFGRPVTTKFVDEHFLGEWKYLNKTIFERAEIRADRALLEMATQLRVLDDAQSLNDFFAQTKGPSLGKVIQSDGSVTALYFRDMTNKLIHAARFQWVLDVADAPKIFCYPNDTDRWQRAEIDLFHVMGLIGNLMH